MKKKITTCLLHLLLPVLLTGCLYEQPELTEDGELGVDPTAVTLKANLKLNLKMPAATEGAAALERPAAGATPAYRHRFIVDAYLDRVFVARQVIYQDITDGRSEFSIPVSMKLHARNYEIAVWSDYVQTPNEAQEITGTEDYFYDATSNHLLTVLGSSNYRGNNEYKDAFCATATLNLEEYRNAWNAQVPLDVEMKRPVARYQLEANDVAKFLKFVETDTPTNSYTARVKYSSYLNVGYNVLQKLPRHGLMYLQYEKTFLVSSLKAGENLPFAFDYFFATEDVTTRIPVTLEIVNNASKKTVAGASFNVTGKAGTNTVITYGFLTADPDGGVSIDPGYDNSTDIEIPAQPAD